MKTTVLVTILYMILPHFRKLDMINLMTYDMHGSWDSYTGHNSPLYGHAGETGDDVYYSVDYAAQYYVQNGAPREKINIGLPTYGRTFTLKDPSHSEPLDAATGPGPAGRFTREAGFLSYYEICDILKSGGQVKQIDDQQVPYLVKDNLWVGFDNAQSLTNKVNYIRDQGFGGSMVWAIDLDDFKGTSCGEGPYPLMTAIRDACNARSAGTISPAITNQPSSAATTGTQTQKPNQSQPTQQPAQQSTQQAAQQSTQLPNQSPAQTTPKGASPPCQRRVCYHTNWSQYRPGQGKFFPEDIDPSLCTHLIYSFAKLSNNHLAPFEWNDESTDWSVGLYERFTDLKQNNPGLKTMLAVGGYNLGSAPFTQMVATPQSRKNFIDSAIKFLRDRNFDGLDLDWEYPGNRGSPDSDRHKFTALVQVTPPTCNLMKQNPKTNFFTLWHRHLDKPTKS